MVGHTSGSEAAEDDVADWGDWNETTCSPITCLFCSLKCDQWESAMQHLKQDHNFDFPSIGKQLDFYQKVIRICSVALGVVAILQSNI